METAALAELPWLIHGFSLRYARCGSLDNLPQPRSREFNLGFTANSRRGEVERNRRMFLRALDGTARAASVHQIHSATLWKVARASNRKARASSERPPTAPMLEYRPAGHALPVQQGTKAEHAGDALITSESGVLLTIRIADCLPLLIADRRLRVIAAIHAGWRGTLARVIEKAVGEMRRAFGSCPQDLVAALGPAIGRCCYEVRSDVARSFAAQFPSAAEWFDGPFDQLAYGEDPLWLPWLTMMPPGHVPPAPRVQLDLRACNRWQLIDAGVPEGQIDVSDLCTACRKDLLFSYRRGGPKTGRMMAAIGIRPD